MTRFFYLLLITLLGTTTLLAQQRDIRGQVVDENDDPVIGVSVAVENTTIGTLTDIDGKFNINISSNVKQLVFSYIGYEIQKVDVSSNMKVKLVPKSEMLDAVVVTGMNVIDKRMFSGSANRLDADDIKMSGLADVSRALEGRAAGVSVQNISGTFGTAPRIRVRGATSIYGDSKPLWVVDGVIMDDVTDMGADDLSSGDPMTLISSAIAGLNAEDIETFDILKDGAATSIYGARAMGGVIVVTTKKGRPGHSSINYTGEFTTRLKPSYNNFNIMDSQEQMGFYKELESKGWLNYADIFRRSDSGVYGYMYKLMNAYNKETGDFSLSQREEFKNAYLREAEYRNTDWFDELFSNNIMHNHSVSISSGTEKTNFYASVSAMFDPGWYKKSEVKRYTGNVNATHKISPTVSFNAIVNASYRSQVAPGTVNQTADAVNGTLSRSFDINPYSYALNTSRALGTNEFYSRNYAPFNILYELDNNYIDIDLFDLRVQGQLSWKPLKNLELAGLAVFKYSSTTQNEHIKDYSNRAQAYRAMDDATMQNANIYLYKNPDNRYALPITTLPVGGFYDRTDYSARGYDFRLTANYRLNINDKTVVIFDGGAEYKRLDRSKVKFTGWGVEYETGYATSPGYYYFKQQAESGRRYFSMDDTFARDVAFYVTPTFSYDSRYSLTGVFRYEGSNKLGKSRAARWLPTWNISGAWNIHEESFFEKVKPTISFLKYKLSYSLTADRGPASVTNSLAIFSPYDPFRPIGDTQEPGLERDYSENADLTYEKKQEFSTGIEAGFLDNRINTVIEYFTRKNYDLIGATMTQGVGGEGSKFANTADMNSYGAEFSLTTHNIATKDFRWTSNFVLGFVKTKVKELKTKTRVFNLISGSGFTMEGYPHRGLFSIPFLGLNKDGLPVFINQDGKETTGDVNLQETEKMDFLIYEGPTDPTTTGSFGNMFTYKNLSLNIFMTYAFGNVVRLDPAFKRSYTDLESTPKEFKNRWLLPGDENVTNVPAVISKRQSSKIPYISRTYNIYNYTSERIAKGDFIRMKEISLSYNFPKKLLSNKLNSLSLKVQATNLFLIYSDKKLLGQDPEFFNAGGVASPVPKQFTLTLRVGF